MSISTVQELTSEIDRLLEQYLHLLDQYSSLRSELSSLSSSMYINLSRANFMPQNGIRYDTSFYHDRIQAQRLCTVTIPENASNTQSVKLTAPALFAINETSSSKSESDLSKNDTNGEDTKTVFKKDPLRMFGLFTPQALKNTQGDSIKMMDVIPKLVTTEKAMEDLEIRIRRARKYRGKAEMEEKKNSPAETHRETINPV
ncbi:predicted protein [Sclerotinia sclerotiorum 1980 UF-70]|uniref:Vacuolar ATPase assembly protein VMA22 n=2 Tax=Sclerotinia sclerotiorum (strain ATCC 18683 / 1980 / Ss-1) TaxID=665079 RepID=A7F7Z7_SCLS1|nr:predicted protein [Sclerotinia sclerotiorum 1980 UF-70]APA14942.1 hypothetical protein sscle_14g097120 [Sclerotinia sclerotiorum 1980 UF-70]EDN98868.1 predicted protein [Sclerotinia sclerotiorum 1980 UF-70]